MGKLIRFPRKIFACRGCGDRYRIPPSGICPNCQHWQKQWLTLQSNIKALRQGES